MCCVDGVLLINLLSMGKGYESLHVKNKFPLWVWVWVWVWVWWLLIEASSAESESESSFNLCRRSCGDLSIEYPFGIDDGCGSLEYRSLLVCSNNDTQLELRTPTGRYAVANISYDAHDPHVIISDPSMWTCGSKLPQSHSHGSQNQRFSLDTSKKFSISNANNFLYFNCNQSSVLLQPHQLQLPESESVCDSNNYLCKNLPDCPKALAHSHASCCSYYPRTSDSLRFMLENCESYTAIYSRDVGIAGSAPAYGIRLNYEIPITATECLSCRQGGGSCGYHTQFSTFLCLCEHTNLTTSTSASTSCSALDDRHVHERRAVAVAVSVGVAGAVGVGGIVGVLIIIRYFRKRNRPCLRLGRVVNTTNIPLP